MPVTPESNIPATTETVVLEPTAADVAAEARYAALANANFGPREQTVLDAANIAGVNPQQQQQQPIHNVNITLVQHREGELAPQGDKSEDDETPDLEFTEDYDPD